VLWAMARNRDERIDSLETLIRELTPFASEHALRAQMTELDSPLPLVGGGAAALLPLSRGRQEASAGRVDTDGHIRRPLANSVHPRSASAAQPRGHRWSVPIVGGLIAILLLGVGMWLLRGAVDKRADDTASTAVSPQPGASSPVEPPPQLPAIEPNPTPSVEPPPLRVKPSAPVPESRPSASRPKPLWLQRWEARSNGTQPRWPKPVLPAPPSEEHPRAGPLRDEDL